MYHIGVMGSKQVSLAVKISSFRSIFNGLPVVRNMNSRVFLDKLIKVNEPFHSLLRFSFEVLFVQEM